MIRLKEEAQAITTDQIISNKSRRIHSSNVLNN